MYLLLSEGEKNKRIYFDDFIKNFYVPLFDSVPIVKAKFMFKILDFDGDGYLHASDLVQAQQFVDELSEFGEELNKLVDYYVQCQLKTSYRMQVN